MTNLVLLRHGESYANIGKVTKDHQNLLTDFGVQETYFNARVFKRKYPELEFDAVVISSLIRAQQTAFNFLSTIDNKAIDLVVTERLRERNYGHGSQEDYIATHGQKAFDSWNNDLTIRPFTNGESFVDLYGRVVSAYEELVVPHLENGKRVLVVSHYFVMQCLQSHIEYGSVDQALSFHPKNSVPVLYKVPFPQLVSM